MNINSSTFKSSNIRICDDPTLIIPKNLTTNSISTNDIYVSSGIGVISEFDELLAESQRSKLVDDDGWVLQEVHKKYPLKPLKLEEVNSFIELLLHPIKKDIKVNSNQKAQLTYTLLEYFQYQIKEAHKHFGIEITSVNMIGGKLPQLLKSYYIRTVNETYHSRCKDLDITPKKEGLISDEVSADLDREAPDTDFISTIKYDTLFLLDRVGTRCFAEKLPERYGTIESREKIIKEYKQRLIAKQVLRDSLEKEVDAAIEAGALALVNNLGTRFFASKLPGTLGKLHVREGIIKQTKNFYHEFCSVGDFALASFGPENCIFDSNFVHEKNINRSLLLHHSEKLDLLKMIEGLSSNSKHLNQKTLFKLIPKGGLQPILERLWKRMRVADFVNDRALFAYLSNKSIGYGFWDPEMHREFLEKVTFDPLPMLKKKWQNHHFSELVDLITLAFNAIMSLPETPQQSDIALVWWQEMMKWYEEIPNDQQKLTLNEERAPFFITLKEALDKGSIPFFACRGLQIYGCILHSTPQQKYPTFSLRAKITNPEAIWHEVAIFQKLDKKNYSITMPLNLFEAVSTVLKLDAEQLNTLENLTKQLCPKLPYEKALIPKDLVTDKLADEALKCLDHPHKALKTLGFDLFLMHAISKPKQWMLKNLLKYFAVVWGCTEKEHRQRLMANFEKALKGFPDNETGELTAPFIKVCEFAKTTEHSLLDICLAMVATNDSDLIYSAINQEIDVQSKLKLIKALLPGQVSVAAKLLLKLQKGNLLSKEEEYLTFIEISEVVKKNSQNHLYHSQSLNLSDCAEQLILHDKMHASEVAMVMAKSFLSQQRLEDVQKWMERILQIASGSNDPEAQFFVPQKFYIPLYSLDLPPKAKEALHALINLDDEELKLFIYLIELLPRKDSLKCKQVGDIYQMQTLVNLAKECLKHNNLKIKDIGFELLLICAKSFLATSNVKNSSGISEVDPLLLTVLISYLPTVLSGVTPTKREILLNAMKELLLFSASSKSAEHFIASLSKAGIAIDNKKYISQEISLEDARLKRFYKANCIALAASKDLKLCQLVKDLVGQEVIRKCIPAFRGQDQILIALKTVANLLPEQLEVALDILQNLEKENKDYKVLASQSKLGRLKCKIHIAICNLYIDQNQLQKARDLGIKCLNEKIFMAEEAACTETLINMCWKSLNNNYGALATAKLWEHYKKQGFISSTHMPAQQIDFMNELLKRLYDLKAPSSDNYVKALLKHMESFQLTKEQLSKISKLVVDNLNFSQKSDIHKLRQSYPLLKDKETNWDSLNDYLALLISWLKAAQKVEGNLQEEIKGLLTNILQIICTEKSEEFSCLDDSIKTVISLLKEVEHKDNKIGKELNIQIISAFPLIAKKLQTSETIDHYFDFFQCLKRQKLINKIPGNVANLSLWLTGEIINKYPNDPTKLKDLQTLLKECIYKADLNSLTIDKDKRLIPKNLATVLIENQQHDDAKDWIDFTLKMQKSSLLTDADLAQDLCSWCESFLDNQQTQYFLRLLFVLYSPPNVLIDKMIEKLSLAFTKACLPNFTPEIFQVITLSFKALSAESGKNDLLKIGEKRFDLKEIYTHAIENLIDLNDVQNAQDLITLCLKNKVYKIEDAKITDLWIQLCQKALKHKDFGAIKAARLWIDHKNIGGYSKKHHAELQIDLLLDLIHGLNELKNCTNGILVDELFNSLKSVDFKKEQKTKFTDLFVSHLSNIEKVDLSQLKYGLTLIKNIPETNVEYFTLAASWLKASRQDTKNLQSDSIQLLVNLLKILQKRQSNEVQSEIVQICDLLISVMKDIEPNESQEQKELHDQMIFAHEMFIPTLQLDQNLDLHLDYFQLIHRLNLIAKIGGNIVIQSLGLAKAILTTYPKDPFKLLCLHQILKDCLYNVDVIHLNINEDIKVGSIIMTSALIENQLHDTARDSIDFVLKLQKTPFLQKTDLSCEMNSWCVEFLNKGQLEYSLKLIKALLQKPNKLSQQKLESLCLKFSTAFLSGYPTAVLKLVDYTFIKCPISIENLDVQAYDRRLEIIEIMSESENKELNKVAYEYLLTLKTKITQEGVLNDPIKWAKICDYLIHRLSFEYSEQLTLSQKLHELIALQASLIQLIPEIQRSDFEKKLALYTLRTYGEKNFDWIESQQSLYFQKLNAYADDDWYESSTEIVAMNLINWAFNSNHSATLMKFFALFATSFSDCSQRRLNCYLIEIVKAVLNLKANDSETRSMLLHIAGKSLNELIEFYMKDSLTRNIFNKNDDWEGKDLCWISQEDLEAQKNVEELICLTEKYLFSRPVLETERSLILSYEKPLVEQKSTLEDFPEPNTIKNSNGTPNSKISFKLSLSRNGFYNLQALIVSNLEVWGYDITYPIQALVFQIMLRDGPCIIKYNDEEFYDLFQQFNQFVSEKDVPQTNASNSSDVALKENAAKPSEICEKQKFIFKSFQNATAVNHFAALKKTIEILTSHKDLHSSEKVLSIFDAISGKLWDNFPGELINLFKIGIGENSLYPSKIKQIGSSIFELANFFTLYNMPLSLITELCICFFKKMQENSLFDLSVSKDTDYIYAVSFIPTCLLTIAFDKQNPEFISLFDFQLEQMLKCKIDDMNATIIPQFIYNSIKQGRPNSCKNREALFTILAQKFDYLFQTNEKSLTTNLKTFNVLEQSDFFKTRINLLDTTWKILYDQFPNAGTLNSMNQMVLKELITVLFLFVRSYTSNSEMPIRISNLLSKIGNNIDNFIIKKSDAFINNVEIFHLICSWGYYKNDNLGFTNTLDLLIDQLLDRESKLQGTDFIPEISYELLVKLCERCPNKTREEKKQLIKRFNK